MRLLFEAAQGTNSDWVRDIVANTPMSSRAKYEEVVFALACCVHRSSNGGGEPAPAVGGMAARDPLSAEELIGACTAIVLNTETRSALARLVTYTVCAEAAQQTTYVDIKQSSNRAATSRLAKYLQGVSETCTYNTHGDVYVENRLRLILPAWSTTTVPRGVSPYEVVTELMFRDANDTVRGILDAPIRESLMCFESPDRSLAALCAAVATLAEASGGWPKLNFNEQIRRHASSVPSIAVDVGLRFDCRIGVASGSVVEYSSAWRAPVLDCLLEAIVAARDLGVRSMADIASAVIDNDTTSPAYAYIV